MQKTKHGRWSSNIFIIISLWLFSFLTGAAPSITRSALMFTAVLIGNSFSRKMSIYNSLAVAAFILLLVNPFNLWDVGFQLSFAALVSIAILSKPIARLFSSRNFIVQNIWQLVAVTIAAQALTLPLVIYHFHQFPLSFILSNLIAVPLSSIILYALILLLFISWIHFPAIVAGWFCFYSIKAMNLFIAWVASLSFSRVGNIQLGVTAAILLFLLIVLFAYALLKRSVNSLITAFVISLLFGVQNIIQRVTSSRQSKLIVYNVPGKTAIDIIKGNNFYFIGDSSLYQKNFLQNFHLLPSRIQHQVSLGGYIKTSQLAFNEIQCGTKKLLLLDKNPGTGISPQIKADLLIITASCRWRPVEILKLVSCNTIVLDGTIGGRRITDWKNAADSLHLRLHSVQQQGAFVTGL
jgi:competence protein ComEC